MASLITIFTDNTEEYSSLSTLFSDNGFTTQIVDSISRDLSEVLINDSPNVFLIDLQYNNEGGIDLCYEVKKYFGANVFVIIYSEHSEDYIQVEAFKAGADDYVLSPFNNRVILRRVNALLKRAKNVKIQKPAVLKHQNIKVDRETYRVFSNGEELSFPRKEFEILFLLLSAPNKIFTREEIARKVWKNSVSNVRTIDVHIRKIRGRIGESAIKTVKGLGYRLA